MMPILHSSGVITPGQFGPTRREVERARRLLTAYMSRAGMPSVIATINGTPASMASRIASAAPAGGTKIIEAEAPPWLTASATVFHTGYLAPLSATQVWPPLPGVTPPA